MTYQVEHSISGTDHWYVVRFCRTEAAAIREAFAGSNNGGHTRVSRPIIVLDGDGVDAITGMRDRRNADRIDGYDRDDLGLSPDR